VLIGICDYIFFYKRNLKALVPNHEIKVMQVKLDVSLMVNGEI
jgi:hypothetical protein